MYKMKNYQEERKKKEKDLRPQYQREYDLSPHKDHYMFWEYLDVGRYLLCIICKAQIKYGLWDERRIH